MSKLLLLVLTGVIIFNLGGTKNEQTIPREEGRRIARGIGKTIRVISLDNRTQKRDFSIARLAKQKRMEFNTTRKKTSLLRNNQPFRTSTITPKPQPPKQVEKELVYKYADKYGITRIGLWKMILAESGGNIYAYNEAGNYWGLLQWRNDYYISQARAYGYKWPNVFDPDEHLDVSCRAIKEGQGEMRWPNTYKYLMAYYTNV